MMLDLFNYAVRGLQRRKVRTWLTVIAIIIGVALVVALVSVGEGLKKNITKQLEAMGTNNIIIIPGSYEALFRTAVGGNNFMMQGRLWKKDVERIKALPGVESADYMVITSSANIKFKGQYATSPVYGVSSMHMLDYMKYYQIEKGRNIMLNDRHTAVLGYRFANELFDEKIDVGSTIYINGVKYRVVGVMALIGGIDESDDFVVFIPLDEAVEFAGDRLMKDEISFIYVHVQGNVDKAAERIRNELRSSHKLGNAEDDFTIMTPEFITQQIDLILNTVTLFLGFISGISLIVGAIGIMNTMYMVIIERTREIGTLKAIGAKDRQIIISLIMESGLLGFIGGVIGVGFGILFSLIIKSFGLNAMVSPIIAVSAIIAAAIIGILAGLIPARRILKLDPTEALRYE